MSLASLESALGEASRQMKPGQPHYPQLFEADGTTPVRHFPNWLVDPIVDGIIQTDELQPLLSKNLNTLNSSGRTSAWHVAQAAVHRLLTDVPPDTVVSDLVDFANAGECSNLTYVGIYGGGVTERVDLDSNVSVMPASAAPKSLARELVFGIDRWDRQIIQKGLPLIRPNVAILVTQPIQSLTRDPYIDTQRLQYLQDNVQRAILALTLSSGCPFTRSWQISWLDHPAVPYNGIDGYGATGLLEEAPRLRVETGQPVNADLARRLFLELKALPLNIKAPVELATDRLRLSRVHHPSADTALDLGIAGEIILLNSSAASEISYRFALRGAYLIATDRQDRMEKFEAFRAMYHARSRAAHTGILEAKHQARLPEFDLLCRTAICEVIRRREFPNWDELILGTEMKEPPSEQVEPN